MNTVVRRNTIACYITDLVLGTFFQLPIWIAYQSKFLTFQQIAFFSGLALITEVLTQLPTGAFADILGRRYSLALGNLFMALPMFLIALYPVPASMWGYAVMWGLGRAFCMGTSKPILYDTLAKYGDIAHYQKILSKSVIFFQFSAAASILAGGYLYLLRPNLPYLFSGFASLIGVFTAFLFVEEKRDSRSSQLSKFVSTAKDGFLEIFKDSYITKLSLVYILTLGIAQTSQQFFMQPYMLELGMSDIARSWAAMSIKLSTALLGARAVATRGLVSHRYYLLIIPMLLVISLIPAAFATLPWGYFIFLIIAFTSGNTDLFLSPELHKHITSHVRSTAISIERMFASTFGAAIQWLSIIVISGQSIGTYYSYLGIFALLVILPLSYQLKPVAIAHK